MHDRMQDRLEDDVLTMLLKGDDPVLGILREQAQVATKGQRKFTAVGFFTSLHLPQAAPRLEGNPSIRFGDVIARIPCLHIPADFILFVDQGALNVLEGFTTGEDLWPE